MTAFKDMQSLKKALQKQMRSAMEEVDKKGLAAAQENVEGFYTGNPAYYKRTGMLGASAESTGVYGDRDNLKTTIYLNQSYKYDTGSWSTAQVMDAAENDYLVGTGGFWEKTKEDIEDIIDDAFTKAGFTKKG